MLLKYAWILPLALMVMRPAWASEGSPMSLEQASAEYGPILRKLLAQAHIGALKQKEIDEFQKIKESVLAAVKESETLKAQGEGLVKAVEKAVEAAARGETKGALKELLQGAVDIGPEAVKAVEGIVDTLVEDTEVADKVIEEVVQELKLPGAAVGDVNGVFERAKKGRQEAQKLKQRFDELHSRALTLEGLAEIQEELCGTTKEYAEKIGENDAVQLNRALCSYIEGEPTSLTSFAAGTIALCERVGIAAGPCKDARKGLDRLEQATEGLEDFAEAREDVNAAKVELSYMEEAEEPEPQENVPVEEGLTKEQHEELTKFIQIMKAQLASSKEEEVSGSLRQKVEGLVKSFGELSLQMPSASLVAQVLKAIEAEVKRPYGGVPPICTTFVSGKFSGAPESELLRSSCTKGLLDMVQELGTNSLEEVAGKFQGLSEEEQEKLLEIVESVKKRSIESPGDLGADPLEDVPPTGGPGFEPSSTQVAPISAPSPTPEHLPGGAATARGSARGTVLARAAQKLADAIKAGGTPIVLDGFTTDELITLSNEEDQCKVLVASVQPETVYAKKDLLQETACKSTHMSNAVANLSDGPLKKAWSEVCGVGGRNYVLWTFIAIIALGLSGAAIGGVIFFMRSR